MPVFAVGVDPRAWRLKRRTLQQSLALGLAACATVSALANPPPELTTLSLEQLLDVTIIGASKYEQKQGEAAAAVSVITRQEIKAFGWRTLAEALASLPGVYASYDRRNTYIGSRGFGQPGDYETRVLVLVDGNRINNPTIDSGPVGRDFPIDLDLIERIEFIPGPGGAVYGQNAMLGVVNVITRKGAGLAGAELAAAYQAPQALGEGRVSWGKALDDGTDVLVSMSGLHALGEDRYYRYGVSGIAGVAAGLDGEHDRQFFARIAHGPWTLEEAYGWRRKDDPTAAFFSDPLRSGQFLDIRLALTQLLYEQGVADNSVLVSVRLFNGATGSGAHLSYADKLYHGDIESRWRGGEMRLLSTALAGHKLMLGIEGHDNVRSDQMVPSLTVPGAFFVISTPGYRVGIYAQDEWRITDTLAATLGLRVDNNDRTGTHSSPRLALIWQAASATTLKALYGRAYRAPNAYEQDYADGVTQVANPALQGERIDTLELVADQRVGRDLTLRASVYHWAMRDLITQGIDPLSGLPQYQSGETVRANGVELSADKIWDSGFRLRDSLSVQDAAYVSGRALLNSPEVLGKLNLSGPLPWVGLRMGYELRYDSSRLSRDGTTLGGYTISNLTLSTDILAKGLELSTGIYNLFGKRYAQPNAAGSWQNAVEQDGRSIRVQLTYGF
jgi:iron complex outermembrane receptor protein